MLLSTGRMCTVVLRKAASRSIFQKRQGTNFTIFQLIKAKLLVTIFTILSFRITASGRFFYASMVKRIPGS